MKISFVVTHLSHGSPGSFERIRSLACHLTAQGVQTSILTPFSEDKRNITNVNMSVIPNLTMSNSVISSIAYNLARKLNSNPLTSSLFLSDKSVMRMVNLIRKGMHRICSSQHIDVIHAVQPIAGLACGPLAKEFGIPLITDLHNVWPEEAMALGQIEKDDDTYKRLHCYEQSLIDSSDGLTVVSEAMKDYLSSNYSLGKKPVIVVPPSGTIREMPNNLQRERNVVYSGLVNKIEHVDLFANSIPLIKQSGNFYISNKGDALKDVKKVTTNFRDKGKHVNYIWHRRLEDAIEFLKRSWIGIVSSMRSVSRGIGPPLKIYEYMSVGLPVVANDIGGWSKFIADERIGLLTSDDPKEFGEAIDSLLSDTSLWRQFQTNALSLIRTKYNWGITTSEILLPFYRKIIQVAN